MLVLGHIRLVIVFTAAALLTVGAAGQAFAPTGSLTFEVASIKPSTPGEAYVGIHPTPGGQRYVAASSPLRDYLYVAYQVRPEQITGGPGWVETEFYDMNAEAERPASIEDLHIMLQNLLTERFKLRFHYETKEMPAYVLTVDKGGPKNLKVHPNASGGDVHLDRAAGGSRPGKVECTLRLHEFLYLAALPVVRTALRQSDQLGWLLRVRANICARATACSLSRKRCAGNSHH